MILIEGKKPLICIDPGHGGHDSGALGPSGQKESDIVLKISKELVYQLELKKIDSFLTREGDTYPSLSKRCELADEKDALLFLSIHCNAFNHPNAEGIETLYYNKSGRGKALANYIQQAMMKYCPDHKNRGIKGSPSKDYKRRLYVLSETSMPAALVECEFISHAEQVKWLEKDETHRQIAHALSEAILSYLRSLPGGQCVEEPLDVDGLMEFIEEGAKIEENETEPEFNFDLDLEEEMEDGEF